MKKIFGKESSVLSILRTQDALSQKEYRPISFCVLTKIDGKEVAYHTLTKTLWEITPEEKAWLTAEKLPYSEALLSLIENWLLVPTDTKDIALADEVIALAREIEAARCGDTYRKYTIFTTMDCNARCFYCYELGRQRLPMSADTAKTAADFIIRHYNGKSVQLTWFGGEPLYNAGVIDIITGVLRDAGVRFASEMASNAYLFDDAAVEKAANDWKLKRVQVTLDGTEEVYNSAKAFIYKGTNAFRVVTDNIERLLQKKIRVNVRMNMGRHNKEDLYRLVDWLCARYPDRSDLRVYPHLLFEDDRMHPFSGEEEKMQYVRGLLELEQYCMEKELLAVSSIDRHQIVTNCIADSFDSLTILPSGKLGKCEHFSEEHFVGDLENGITNPGEAELLARRMNDEAVCGGCAYYPICMRLSMCPNQLSGGCPPAAKLLKSAKFLRELEKTYRDAIANPEAEQKI